MAEKTIPNEKAIIAEAMRRRGLNEPLIPSDQFKRFKALLGAEIARTGKLSREYVDELLKQLKSGEL